MLPGYVAIAPAFAVVIWTGGPQRAHPMCCIQNGRPSGEVIRFNGPTCSGVMVVLSPSRLRLTQECTLEESLRLPTTPMLRLTQLCFQQPFVCALRLPSLPPYWKIVATTFSPKGCSNQRPSVDRLHEPDEWLCGPIRLVCATLCACADKLTRRHTFPGQCVHPSQPVRARNTRTSKEILRHGIAEMSSTVCAGGVNMYHCSWAHT